MAVDRLAAGVQAVALAMSVRIHIGDCREVLAGMEPESVHCVVTSPPYWGLRDYGVGAGALGLEPTPDLFIEHMVEVFRQVRRALRDDGTLWLNMGDSYTSHMFGEARGIPYKRHKIPQQSNWKGTALESRKSHIGNADEVVRRHGGLKPKDLCMMPARVALALQADGWWLRSEIIWHKPNPMPESVTDRPTNAHEKVFLLAKSQRYYYDAEAVREPYQYGRDHHRNVDNPQASHVPGASPIHTGLRRSGNKARKLGDERDRPGSHLDASVPWEEGDKGRNLRNVWTIPTAPFSEAHFATFPPALVEPCIKAGCPTGGTVLDPFGGAGTTGLVAERLGRNAILIEANPEYAAMAEKRIRNDATLFADVKIDDLKGEPDGNQVSVPASGGTAT